MLTIQQSDDDFNELIPLSNYLFLSTKAIITKIPSSRNENPLNTLFSINTNSNVNNLTKIEKQQFIFINSFKRKL